MIRRRLSAFCLLFALLGAGFGLPLADALLYHTAAVQHQASSTDESAVRTPGAPAHVVGCVLWLSALTGSGIQGSSPSLQTAAAVHSDAARVALALFCIQTDLSLGLSRAPPVA